MLGYWDLVISSVRLSKVAFLTADSLLHHIANMLRTQIQLPEPLYDRLKQVAHERDWSMAELIRRGMEAYVQTCPEASPGQKAWTMPVLRRSGGLLVDPASVSPEADAIEQRFSRS